MNDKEVIYMDVLQQNLGVMVKDRKARVLEWSDYKYDVKEPRERLIVAGTGKDAVSFAEFASNAGFSVTILEPSIEIHSEHVQPYSIVKERDKVDGCWWVIMKNRQKQDEVALKIAIQNNPKYIGVFGPVSRTQEMLVNIGENLNEIKSDYSPVGLDIGAETLAELAVSLEAELMMVSNNLSKVKISL